MVSNFIQPRNRPPSVPRQLRLVTIALMKGEVLYQQAVTALEKLDFEFEHSVEDEGCVAEVARQLVPGVVVDHVDGMEFYVSFHPLRIASQLRPFTGDSIRIEDKHCDPDALQWVFLLNDEEHTIQGSKRLAKQFVNLLANATAEWSFVLIQPSRRHQWRKLVVCKSEHEQELRKLLGTR